ncbi:MAG: RNA methyltransferase [Calditrichaceae bacterium]
MSKRYGFTEEFEKIRENLHFILVSPEFPGNIGAVARAIKTCGFKKLILVNPCDLNHLDLRMMAHRSIDIIENAKIVDSFDEAISDMCLTVGTTMRNRHFKFPFIDPKETALRLQDVARQHPVGIVFGRERTGLTNEELTKCHLHSSIATATQNPALNLSQAVMIYAYTFFDLHNTVEKSYSYDLASQNELEIYYEHLIDSMKRVNFVPRDGYDKFIIRVKRMLGRSMAEKRDVRLLHKLLQIFETRITDLEKMCQNHDKRDIF